MSKNEGLCVYYMQRYLELDVLTFVLSAVIAYISLKVNGNCFFVLEEKFVYCFQLFIIH